MGYSIICFLSLFVVVVFLLLLLLLLLVCVCVCERDYFVSLPSKMFTINMHGKVHLSDESV